MKTKTYDLVKTLLEDNPELRDSDKKLIWAVWEDLNLTEKEEFGIMNNDTIRFDSFMDAPSTETIRRCRQSIQEHNPELRGSKWVQKARAEKAEQKGSFVYREEVLVQDSML